MADPARNPATRYEPTDVPLRLVGWLGAGLAGAIVATPLIVLAIYPGTRHDAPRGPTEMPPAPRLQTTPALDLAEHRAEEERLLSSWGWADRARGAVRMPIEEAMRRVARDGIADWPAAKPAGAAAR
jgi:hypothetical protein